MNSSPRVESIYIYPVKSFDGVSVVQRQVTTGGALQGDREFAIVGDDGTPVTGKNEPRLF
jgi:uncharacterized protein YcbX